MFVSYAQNFEDVILWRALKHVSNGFYVDIGAQDPNNDSVSKGFYEKGWRGMHVEPTAMYSKKLRDAREGEEVVEAAIGLGDDPIDFFEIPETGLSTGNAEIADIHRNNNLVVIKRSVAQMRLAALFDRIGDRDIHWLKIDVEGMEREVIESWSPSHARPWIVVVESTLPNTQIATFSEWEPQLVILGYEYVYFDGLSRFYVHSSRSEFKNAFGPGPNIFDKFSLGITSPMLSAYNEFVMKYELRSQELIEQISRLEAEIKSKTLLADELGGMLSNRDAEFRELQSKLQTLQSNFQSLLDSWRWKLSRPLRVLDKARRALMRPKQNPRQILENTLVRYCRKPHRKSRLLKVARYVPSLKRWILELTDQQQTSWAIDPAPHVLADWKKITAAPSNPRHGGV